MGGKGNMDYGLLFILSFRVESAHSVMSEVKAQGILTFKHLYLGTVLSSLSAWNRGEAFHVRHRKEEQSGYIYNKEIPTPQLFQNTVSVQIEFKVWEGI